jgi:hypothetical protein
VQREAKRVAEMAAAAVMAAATSSAETGEFPRVVLTPGGRAAAAPARVAPSADPTPEPEAERHDPELERREPQPERREPESNGYAPEPDGYAPEPEGYGPVPDRYQPEPGRYPEPPRYEPDNGNGVPAQRVPHPYMAAAYLPGYNGESRVEAGEA